MTKKITSLTIFSLVLCFAAFTSAVDNAKCSNATLNGSYGFYRSGTGPDGQLAAVGIVSFDGKGHAQVKQKVSTNGAHHSSEFSIEYRVAKDCTYKSSLDGQVGPYGVVVDNGNRIFLLSMTPGSTVSGVWEKIHQD